MNDNFFHNGLFSVPTHPALPFLCISTKHVDWVKCRVEGEQKKVYFIVIKTNEFETILTTWKVHGEHRPPSILLNLKALISKQKERILCSYIQNDIILIFYHIFQSSFSSSQTWIQFEQHPSITLKYLQLFGLKSLLRSKILVWMDEWIDWLEW